jgi:hypothetical protein
MAPLDLYRLWSHEIGLDGDRRDWDALPEELRDEAGHERVRVHGPVAPPEGDRVGLPAVAA